MLFSFLISLLLSVAVLGQDTEAAGGHKKTIALKASGGDDGPNFVSAVLNPRYDVVKIPRGTTLNISTKMDMTSARNKHILVEGTVKFHPDIEYWVANAFNFTYQNQIGYWQLGGENILLDGGGTLDGSGQPWYDAFEEDGLLPRPIILTIMNGRNVVVKNIKEINSPEWFNLVYQSRNVVYSNIEISAVSTSSADHHNTDGWDIYRSDRVVIKDSHINNGDDCVSFKPNATNVFVSNLDCTGSHGISVGSLGQYPGVYDIVENVTSTNIRMSNASNGARIKAWAGQNHGGGMVKNVIFHNFVVSEVETPVNIDQCYMQSPENCTAFPSNTYIQNVIFSDISGAGSEPIVAQINCSPDGRCSNIAVNDLDLIGDGDTIYKCENVVLSGNSAHLFGNCTFT